MEKVLSPDEGMTDWRGTVRICPNCGFENIDQTFYCSRCAAQIREFPKESPFTESNRNSSSNKKINSQLGRRRRNKKNSDSSQKGLGMLIAKNTGMFLSCLLVSFVGILIIPLIFGAVNPLDILLHPMFLEVWLIGSISLFVVYYFSEYYADKEIRQEIDEERNRGITSQKKL